MIDFHTLQIWARSHKFSVDIYKLTVNFPQSETFGLTSQIRRASTSIPINIAEGSGRGSNADFARFLQIAIGSASEVEEELLLSKDLNFISESDWNVFTKEIKEIRSMITAYQSRLK